MIFAPRCTRLSWNRFDPCDSLTFHLQIHFRVTIRCGQAGVPQEVTDGRESDTSLQKGNGRAMTHAMRVEPFLAEIRLFPASTVGLRN